MLPVAQLLVAATLKFWGLLTAVDRVLVQKPLRVFFIHSLQNLAVFLETLGLNRVMQPDCKHTRLLGKLEGLLYVCVCRGGRGR